MGLQNLSIRQFRCFTVLDLEFSSHLNVIEGKNASGKTSILEAIFLLSRGRSFRTAHLGAVTRLGTQGFLLAARVTSRLSQVEISLTRHDGCLEPKVYGRTVGTISQLAAILPVQLLDSQTNQLIQGGPKYRRQFLDWGAFHVEPNFHDVWQRFHRALKQRNILLTKKRPMDEISTWDIELSRQGEALDQIRQRYLQDIHPHVFESAKQILAGVSVSLDYRRGWPEDVSLADALKTSSKRDRLLGVTHVGPHRSDLIIQVNGRPAQEAISRGQEKVLAASLLLAQAAFYQQQAGLPCTLLVDDLSAELDAEYLSKLLQRIQEVGTQVVMTTIDSASGLIKKADAVFHVKQGKCHRVV